MRWISLSGMANSSLQRLLDAGVQFGEVSRKQAESVVRQLVKAGEVPRTDAEKMVRELVERGKDTSERMSEIIQREVSKQVSWMSERFDEIEDRFEDLSEKLGERVGQKKAASKKAPAKKKAAAKKAPAKKKAAARRPPARRRPPRRRPRPRRLPRRRRLRRSRPSARRACARSRRSARRADHRESMAGRRRLDAELVRRDLAPSRTAAQLLIDADRVLVNGAVAAKASRQVAPGDAVVVDGPPARFVGRGAEKLDHALDEFGVDVAGLRFIDAGASTGGFTDCLLQRGAAEVVAVDVGHGQLHERLRADPRVVNIERQNIRAVTPDRIGGPVDGAVGDLSFISLRLVIDPLVAVCQPGSSMILLVKPQFEAGRAEVSRGRGVVTDPDVHARVRDEIGLSAPRGRLRRRRMDDVADHRSRRKRGVPRACRHTDEQPAPSTPPSERGRTP